MPTPPYNINMKENNLYNDDERFQIVIRICDDVANGVLLTTALEQNGIVSFSTFQYWLNQHADLKELFEDAQKMREAYFFDEIVRVAYSENPKATKKYKGGELIETIVKDSAEDRRLKIQTLKWILAKMNPAKFGEKIMLEAENKAPITSIEILGIEAQDVTNYISTQSEDSTDEIADFDETTD
jgi:hypothetical protein